MGHAVIFSAQANCNQGKIDCFITFFHLSNSRQRSTKELTGSYGRLK